MNDFGRLVSVMPFYRVTRDIYWICLECVPAMSTFKASKSAHVAIISFNASPDNYTVLRAPSLALRAGHYDISHF